MDGSYGVNFIQAETGKTSRFRKETLNGRHGVNFMQAETETATIHIYRKKILGGRQVPIDALFSGAARGKGRRGW